METDGLIQQVRDMFPDDIAVPADEREGEVLILRKDSLLSVFAALKAPPFGFDLLLDVTCVDFVASGNRYEMVYHLCSIGSRRRLRIKVPLAPEDAAVPSLCGLWKNANWLEREVFDMFGVEFRGHPDLRRILTYEGFEGHPLRKSYPLRKRQPLIPMDGQ